MEGIDFGTENMTRETVLEVAKKYNKNGMAMFLEEIFKPESHVFMIKNMF